MQSLSRCYGHAFIIKSPNLAADKAIMAEQKDRFFNLFLNQEMDPVIGYLQYERVALGELYSKFLRFYLGSCYPVDLSLEYCRESHQIGSRLSCKRRETWQREENVGTTAAHRLLRALFGSSAGYSQSATPGWFGGRFCLA